jgi:hypothetical protein
MFFALFYPQTASAHRMLIEHDQQGSSIHVRYDDGTSAGNAIVSAYDENGKMLFEKKTDEAGLLNYDKQKGIYRITADDGMGHRASWMTGEEGSILDDIPILVRAILGASILLFIAAIFLLRTTRKSGEGEKKE